MPSVRDTVEIEFEVWCSCGNGLCNQTSDHRTKKGIIVEPCELCLKKSRDEGYDEGLDEGRNEEREK